MTRALPAERIELRLALVCYGGVSLAVYMHGVTKELHKLVQASRAFDAAGDLDEETGTYTAFLDVTAPALSISPLTVGGFFGGGSGPATVSVGSAAPGDDPSILAVYPNNAPGDQYEIVTTTT